MMYCCAMCGTELDGPGDRCPACGYRGPAEPWPEDDGPEPE